MTGLFSSTRARALGLTAILAIAMGAAFVLSNGGSASAKSGEVEVKGIVKAFTAAVPGLGGAPGIDGSITIESTSKKTGLVTTRMFVVTPRTEIEDENPPLTVGSCAKVEGKMKGTPPVLTAKEIETLPAAKCMVAPLPVLVPVV